MTQLKNYGEVLARNFRRKHFIDILKGNLSEKLDPATEVIDVDEEDDEEDDGDYEESSDEENETEDDYDYDHGSGCESEVENDPADNINNIDGVDGIRGFLKDVQERFTPEQLEYKGCQKMMDALERDSSFSSTVSFGESAEEVLGYIKEGFNEIDLESLTYGELAKLCQLTKVCRPTELERMNCVVLSLLKYDGNTAEEYRMVHLLLEHFKTYANHEVGEPSSFEFELSTDPFRYLFLDTKKDLLALSYNGCDSQLTMKAALDFIEEKRLEVFSALKERVL